MMQSRQQWTRMLWLACALYALPSCFGGQTGQESRSEDSGDPCVEASAIADDLVTKLGFSARQAADAFAGPFDGRPFHWYDSGGSTRVTLSVQYAGNAAQLVREDCVDRVSLEVTVMIATEDGLLDESLPATLEVTNLNTARLSVQVAIGALRGSYDDAMTGGELRIDVQLGQLPSSGVVRLLDGNDTETVVGEWPAAS